jgi:hypothetical protein
LSLKDLEDLLVRLVREGDGYPWPGTEGAATKDSRKARGWQEQLTERCGRGYDRPHSHLVAELAILLNSIF